MVGRRAVFLDRDGVLNRSKVIDGKAYAPRTLAEFELLPGVTEACNALAEAGYLLFVVTNQPDIGNGTVDFAIVEQMHKQLQEKLPLTHVYCCPHKQTAGCTCRKPQPGMLLEAKKCYNINMKESFMVGDRYSDVQAGQTAGCTPIFIDYKYIETPDFGGTLRVEDLHQASTHILQQRS